ncbi:aldo/keto reductase [Pseudofrankia inefficax]|uniref:2,5-didehydrogluconate reductase n=1 Tax=Pseudofrankia inefficax (strain DSM 45817 / CECT 9037 / DDB 130130 / EuI1c) TaxID=298654 RepID=E3IV57_PSEI1|nr:aldo/keto reductase [Pseudofrankia inefficax]ADP80077.1 2,5-didehydrogluconate reductase [Pseudofrankia inefficax]
MVRVPTRTMNDGRALPVLGLGTYRTDDAAAADAVRAGLAAGYRLIDTAASYYNEAGVGQGIVTSDVPRDEILVTTKLMGVDHGYEPALRAFDESRKRLGLEYVDLYLIHWPLPRLDRYVESWRALLRLRDDGLVRSVGVSNFNPAHVERLLAETGVAPAVNQVEMHPYFAQEPVRAYNAAHGIVTQAWQPLARKTALLAEPALAEIATSHGVSPAQVVLRWHLQRDVVPIPKSATPSRQRENLDVFGFTLTDAELAALVDRPQARSGADPDDPALT